MDRTSQAVLAYLAKEQNRTTLIDIESVLLVAFNTPRFEFLWVMSDLEEDGFIAVADEKISLTTRGFLETRRAAA